MLQLQFCNSSFLKIFGCSSDPSEVQQQSSPSRTCLIDDVQTEIHACQIIMPLVGETLSSYVRLEFLKTSSNELLSYRIFIAQGENRFLTDFSAGFSSFVKPLTTELEYLVFAL